MMENVTIEYGVHESNKNVFYISQYNWLRGRIKFYCEDNIDNLIAPEYITAIFRVKRKEVANG